MLQSQCTQGYSIEEGVKVVIEVPQPVIGEVVGLFAAGSAGSGGVK